MAALRVLLVVMAAVGVLGAERCAFRAGDVWSGQFRKTLIVPTLSEAAVSFTFSPDAYVIETNPLGSSWARWVQAGPNVVMQSFATSPASMACPAHSIAKYEAVWAADCSSVTLEVVHDECQHRTSLYTTMTLRKDDVPAPVPGACHMTAGTTWVGIYPQRTPANEFGGERVHVTVAPKGAMVEVSARGVVFSQFAAQENGARVEVTDIAALAAELACPATMEGAYTLAFSASCDEVTFKDAGDTCAGRIARYDDLQLVRVDADVTRAGGLFARGSYGTTTTTTTTHTTTHTSTTMSTVTL